jgi:hypothetical protein
VARPVGLCDAPVVGSGDRFWHPAERQSIGSSDPTVPSACSMSATVLPTSTTEA